MIAAAVLWIAATVLAAAYLAWPEAREPGRHRYSPKT